MLARTAVVLLLLPPLSSAAQKRSVTAFGNSVCRSVTFEGEVRAGEAFRKQFTPGLEFFLEPLRSGWIVRVLAMRDGREVREARDYAGVATPPYRSVSPLLISTDWAFRAQDAMAWNPRTFRYAADAATFARLGEEMGRIVSGDRTHEGDLASLVVQQPEATLRILDATIVPGAQNRAAQAGSVATEHAPASVEIGSGAPVTPLGSIRRMHFRVRLDLRPGTMPGQGLNVKQEICASRPTV